MQENPINEVSNVESVSKQRGIKMLNFDTSSYHFSDIDLAMAVRRLPSRDRKIIILHLMGHSQNDIALVLNVTRSMISKKLTKITRALAIFMR